MYRAILIIFLLICQNLNCGPLEIMHWKYSQYADGSILIDTTSDDKHYEYVNVLDVPLIYTDKTEKDENFKLISADILPDLLVSKKLGFNWDKCQILKESIVMNQYAFYGYNIFIHHNSNISPSIIYGITSLPQNIQWKYMDHGILKLEPYFPKRGCQGSLDQYVLGFQLNGITNSSCISNDAIIPGHDDASQYEQMPPIPKICDDSNIPFIKYLSGYKYGYIGNLSNEEMKIVLTRLGPFLGRIYYYDSSQQIIDYREGIILGWNRDKWIITKQIEISEDEYVDRIIYEDSAPFSISGSASIKIQGYVLYCIDDCTPLIVDCSILIGKTLDQCPCLQFDDPRTSECPEEKKCTTITKQTPPSDCPCPQSQSELKKDPRYGGLCKSDSGQLKISWNIPFVVFLTLLLFN
ncbi:MAG: hypothetical protein EZS28_024527 [Streblomastix strix]|uniref:Uncharacterized protein n=1 Tax=Streblomastix strix TaxID=222440 RepID=A0A5J4VBX3_9EUKA|nr:MAG: hypothetical protein EZS28_024527 [Streblomastix strix]